MFLGNISNSEGALEIISLTQDLSILTLSEFLSTLQPASESTFFAAAGQLRKKGVMRCSFHTCNPAGHDWVWKKFKQYKEKQNNTAALKDEKYHTVIAFCSFIELYKLAHYQC